MADKLTRKKDFTLYTLTTPVGSSTVNSRQSVTINDLEGANEVIICVGVSADGSRNQIPFVKCSGVTTYAEYRYIRPPSSDNAYSYDVRWTPASNEVDIRLCYKGSSASTPYIYEVLYR